MKSLLIGNGLNLANNNSDFTEIDIESRTQRIMDAFIEFLSQNELLV